MAPDQTNIIMAQCQDNPQISVIIPTYNCAPYICDAIDSVLAQTFKNFEIIVVDDGSTDNTQSILRKYEDKIRYIHQKNQGVSNARNKGIRESQGEYMAFLDADDIWFNDKLMKQISVTEKNPEIGLIFSDAEVFDERGLTRPSFKPSDAVQYEKGSFKHKIASAIFNDGSILKGDFYEDLLMGNLITLSTVLIHKKRLEEVGCFDESLSISEDYDLWMRIARSHALLYLNRVTTRYRSRDDSFSGKVRLRAFFYQANDGRTLEKQLCICSESYKDLIKKRILGCYKTAVWGYYNLGELKKVRALCLRSLRLDRFQMKLYLYLFAAIFPARFIKSRTRLES